MCARMLDFIILSAVLFTLYEISIVKCSSYSSPYSKICIFIFLSLVHACHRTRRDPRDALHRENPDAP